MLQMWRAVGDRATRCRLYSRFSVILQMSCFRIRHPISKSDHDADYNQEQVMSCQERRQIETAASAVQGWMMDGWMEVDLDWRTNWRARPLPPPKLGRWPSRLTGASAATFQCVTSLPSAVVSPLQPLISSALHSAKLTTAPSVSSLAPCCAPAKYRCLWRPLPDPL